MAGVLRRLAGVPWVPSPCLEVVIPPPERGLAVPRTTRCRACGAWRRAPEKQESPARARLCRPTGATGLEPATSGVTGDPTVSGRVAERGEKPAQTRFSLDSRVTANDAESGGFQPAWTRCGRVEIELRAGSEGF